MSADNNNFDFTELGEGKLDLESIFGEIDGGGQNPFVAPPTPQPMSAPVVVAAAPQQEYPVAVPQPQPAPAPVVAPVPAPVATPTPAPVVIPAPAPAEAAAPVAENPIAAAFGVQEEAFAAQAAQSLFEKLPVFSYGGATESIEDSAQTFEELRIAKADDFPELSEGKKVSWTVEYGKVSKTIADPKAVTIASIKTEIEQSKAFLDALKKAKDKDRNPDCLVKPKVAAQSKGIASYKGVFSTLEEARASDKVICLIPAQNGKVYEMRRNELGEFIAEAGNIVDFSQVRAGFTPALPRIPFGLLREIIAFFRSFMDEQDAFEALAHIYWDKEREEYTVLIPKQEVYHARVQADLRGSALPEERYIHYADIHSHNTMPAKFSAMDDADERATRLYLVVGYLNDYFPDITARVSCGGSYQEIDPATVLEDMDTDFPPQWQTYVTKGKPRFHMEQFLPSDMGDEEQ